MVGGGGRATTYSNTLIGLLPHNYSLYRYLKVQCNLKGLKKPDQITKNNNKRREREERKDKEIKKMD
jgi:hypothetical protein